MRNWLYITGLVFCSSLFAMESNWETKFDAVTYVLPTKRLNEIYGPVWPGFRAEINHPLNKEDGVHFWAAGEFIYADGKTIGMYEPTVMRIYPVGAGLKLQRTFGKYFEGYFGGGPRYAFIQIRNQSKIFTNRINKNGIGAEVFSGLNIWMTKSLLLDVQGGYSWNHFSSKGITGVDLLIDLYIPVARAAAGFNYRF